MQIEYTEDESRIRWERGGEWREADLDELIEAYENKPKSGRWIRKGNTNIWNCSECGSEKVFICPLPKFCDNCGARMDEVGECD